MVDGGFDDELVGLNIDWDHLLDDIPDDLNFDFCDAPVADIGQYLMDDDGSNLPEEIDQEILAGGLFSDALLDSSPGSDRSKDSSAIEVETEGEVKESGVNVVAVDDEDDDDDDPLAKKRRRKMSNRDAAVRSRERKKMYVKDLEMKSTYYEAECKRLGFMLQCCLAENQALRLYMLNNNNTKASDVSMTKQESAVLFLESLLLGSLLGCLGIIYLLILPGHLLSTLEAGLLENKGSGEWENLVSPRRAENKVGRVVFDSFMLGKGCRASRSRMKLRFFTAQVGI